MIALLLCLCVQEPLDIDAVILHHNKAKPHRLAAWEKEAARLADQKRASEAAAKRQQIADLKANRIILFPRLETPFRVGMVGEWPARGVRVVRVLGDKELLFTVGRYTYLLSGVPTRGAADGHDAPIPATPYAVTGTRQVGGTTYLTLEPFDPAPVLSRLQSKR